MGDIVYTLSTPKMMYLGEFYKKADVDIRGYNYSADKKLKLIIYLYRDIGIRKSYLYLESPCYFRDNNTKVKRLIDKDSDKTKFTNYIEKLNKLSELNETEFDERDLIRYINIKLCYSKSNKSLTKEDVFKFIDENNKLFQNYTVSFVE